MQYRKICQHPYLIPHIEPENEPLYGEHLIESCGKMKVLDKLLKKLIN
jgi:SWI/SNF-related matrix-associated actin-dependent regulator of chromatin subfamily A member 5